MGCETWPARDDFKACPVCGSPTRVYGDSTPVSDEDASRHLSQARFEAWLEENGRA